MSISKSLKNDLWRAYKSGFVQAVYPQYAKGYKSGEYGDFVAKKFGEDVAEEIADEFSRDKYRQFHGVGSIAPKGKKNVTKAEIIDAVSKKTNSTKKAATEIVNAYWDVIKSTLKSNPKANITIPNVGSIRCVKTKARTYKVSGLKNTSKKTVKKEGKTTPKFYVSDNFLKTTKSAAPKKRKSAAKAKTKAKSEAKTKTATSKKRSTTKKTANKTSKKK